MIPTTQNYRFFWRRPLLLRDFLKVIRKVLRQYVCVQITPFKDNLEKATAIERGGDWMLARNSLCYLEPTVVNIELSHLELGQGNLEKNR